MIEKKCRISGEIFVIEKDDLEFYAKMNVITDENLSGLLAGKITNCAGLPTLCPAERLRLMMSHRNERVLHQRKCDKSKTVLISAYDKNVEFPIYSNEIWWGDSWSGLDYGQNLNFSRSFFGQFSDLQKKVPREGTSVFSSENSNFNSHTRECKNCYLNTLAVKSENTHYSYWAVGDNDVLDSLITNGSTLCYECIDCENCYECVALQDCHSSNDCFFSSNLKNCENCIGCNNLRFKKNYVFNEKVSEEKFIEFRKQVVSGKFSTYRQGLDYLNKMNLKNSHKNLKNINVENCAGDHLLNSKNCNNCFDGDGSEDCKDSVALNNSKDCRSVSSAGWTGCELLYFSTVSRGCTNLKYCYYSWFCHDLIYCDSCVSCEHCLGCIGLKHKKYCILNKQYTKEEYEELVPKIVEHMKKMGEWGEFFPINISTFSYNESQAQEYFPLTKIEAETRGYKWKEEKQTVQYTGPKYEIADDINDVPDDIIDKVLQCERSQKFYRIQKSELKFYRKMNLPIPRLHPDERHKDRMALRNPRKLWKRNCGDCDCELQTTFAPDRPEKILCEECYLKIVD